MTNNTLRDNPPDRKDDPARGVSPDLPGAPPAIPEELVHRLPHDPIHLYQLNTDPGTYNNPMGCGAFSSAMALSFYDSARFGTYDAAHTIFNQMLKVPFFGGTFESQNAAVAHKYNFFAAPFDHGTVGDLAAAIDLGAPTIMLIRPKTILSIGQYDILRIGQHDVLLVGYSSDAHGNYVNLFINNPWLQNATQPAPAGLAYPGNQTFAVADLPHIWLNCFTPFFASAEALAQWRKATRRG